MVEELLEPVRRGRRVCAAFYGHPGVFVTPSHEAIRQARAEGFPARMLPAVSAEDCLFADLGIDPGAQRLPELRGDRVPRASDRPIDVRAYLILWQISVVGERRTVSSPRQEGLAELAEALLAHYPPSTRSWSTRPRRIRSRTRSSERLPLVGARGRAGDADGDARRPPARDVTASRAAATTFPFAS